MLPNNRYNSYYMFLWCSSDFPMIFSMILSSTNTSAVYNQIDSQYHSEHSGGAGTFQNLENGLANQNTSPKTGSNRAQNMATLLGDCLDVLRFPMYVFLGGFELFQNC